MQLHSAGMRSVPEACVWGLWRRHTAVECSKGSTERFVILRQTHLADESRCSCNEHVLASKAVLNGVQTPSVPTCAKFRNIFTRSVYLCLLEAMLHLVTDNTTSVTLLG